MAGPDHEDSTMDTWRTLSGDAMDDYLNEVIAGAAGGYADYRILWFNIDIWAVTPNRLTREARDRLQARGRQIIAYNIRSSHFDPVGNRVQFWSFFKSGYDGVLHYNPGTAGGEQVGRAAGPWEETLFPSEKRVDGGLHRSFPESAADKTSPFGWRYTTQTMSTVPFEYWREGLEDVEYLYLLRDLRDRLIAAGTDLDEHRRLIEQADRLVEVPESITTGALADQVEVEGEIIRGISGATDSMSTIMAARRETAALIIRIKETLSPLV